VVRYVQLAHNVRHPESGHAVAQVLHSFGREDRLDRDGLARLVGSLSRYLGVEQAPAQVQDAGGQGGLSFVSSKSLGGCWALDGLWRRLGLGELVRRSLAGRRCDPGAVERVLFALVANRVLDPCSKLAAGRWVDKDAHVPGLGVLDEDAAYRAMDLLLEVEATLAEQVFWSTATLLDLEVDLLFFDTSSTYFERDTAEDPVPRDGRGRPVDDSQGTGQDNDGDGGVGEPVGFRTYGHSKDSREDLPQVVIGMAVTRTGIPIRVWCWPGNTADTSVMGQVRADLRDWKLTRVVWVTDRGFASATNRRLLQRGGSHYIQAEKLRGSAEGEAALARPGRYRTVAGNLRIKEIKPRHAQGVMADRFIVCHNPEQAERDATVRERLIALLGERIEGSDALPATKRAELRGKISTMPGLNRYLRVTPAGLLRVDAAAVRRETKLDGKWLLRCSDPSLSPEDIATGYKQLLEVERGWRDMKTHLDLRPVHHRKEERIRAHVLLCWLALLLIRIAENEIPTHTWRRLREELQTLHVVEFTGHAGHVHQRTELTTAQRDILRALKITEPPRFLQLTAAD